MHSSHDQVFKTNLIFFILNIISMHETDAKVCCEILFIFPLNVNNSSSSPHIISRARHTATHHNRSYNTAKIFQYFSHQARNILPSDRARNICKLNRTKHMLLSFLGGGWQRILSGPQSSIL